MTNDRKPGWDAQPSDAAAQPGSPPWSDASKHMATRIGPPPVPSGRMPTPPAPAPVAQVPQLYPQSPTAQPQDQTMFVVAGSGERPPYTGPAALQPGFAADANAPSPQGRMQPMPAGYAPQPVYPAPSAQYPAQPQPYTPPLAPAYGAPAYGAAPAYSAPSPAPAYGAAYNAPAHGSTNAQPYGSQPYGTQPYAGQPYADQPYGGQPSPPYGAQPQGENGYPTYSPAAASPHYNMAAPGQPPYAASTPYGAASDPSADSSSDIPVREVRKVEAAVGRSQRVRFIRLTYLHLLAAILVFAGLLRLLMTNPMLWEKVSAPLVKFALAGRWNWGVVLAAFMAVSWVADRWASSASSRPMQYAGLGFYVVAEALIFVPLLFIVQLKTAAILARGGAEPNIIRDAAFVTLGIFTMLTFTVVISNKDFSFMRGALGIASGAALSLIAMSLVFGFSLGLVFSVAMVLLASGYVLYQTSQVLAHYDPRQHVAASLALFSSVALMFWYVIRIFLRARD